MLLKYFYDDKLAQASYLVGCPANGEALVIDPARDVQPYLDAAEHHGLRITRVVETHIHADYASGAHELAYQTGSTLYLSGHQPEDHPELAYDFADDVDVECVTDGDVITMGSVRLDVIHTPGHTPEHLVLLLTDSDKEQPVGIFTGDCLFVGDMGRPDLLEQSLHVADTQEAGARQQFANMQKLSGMADYLQLWPGHGAGSACGKALGAMPSTTLGYEKLVSPAFQFDDETAFADWLLSDQPEAPHYFGQMKKINRVGPQLLHELDTPLHLDKGDFELARDGGELIIDARSSDEYVKAHMPGTLHVPKTTDRFSTYAGWYIDYDAPVYVLAEKSDLPRLIKELRAIGVDNIPGCFTPEVISGSVETVSRVSVDEATTLVRDGAVILDVRNTNERHDQYIPGSIHIPMGQIPERIDELPRDRLIITQCGSGIRSMVVTSILKNHGFDVANLEGGIDAWIEEGRALEQV